MFQKKYLALAGLLILLILVGAYVVQQNPSMNGDQSSNDFAWTEQEFDFGVIKQSGGIVQHDFAFQYKGDESVTVTGTPASCACTSGHISQTRFEKGDRGVLRVEFDPNLHQEPEGRFYKTVSILTEPPLAELPEVKIWVEIDLDLGPEAFKLSGGDHDEDEEDHQEEATGGFQELTAAELQGMLQKDKDFFLLDVHVPEQEHIAGTDAFIDYRELTENSNQLPSDKDSKLVVYCRSGSMSRAAAADLVRMGYGRVYILEGGKQAFDAL